MNRLRDSLSGDLFFNIPQPAPPVPASMDFRPQLSVLVGDMLAAAQVGNPELDRFLIAGRASRLAGKEISKAMLDGYTAESREAFNLPLWCVPALETACGSTLLTEWLAGIRGGRLVLGPAALDQEIGRLEGEKEEIGERLKLLREHRREGPVMADGSVREVDTLDVRQIAAALGITKRSAERRAVVEVWPFREATGRGGKRRLYDPRLLPSDVIAALNKSRAIAAANSIARSAAYTAGEQLGRRQRLAETIDDAVLQRQREAGSAKAAGITGKAASRMHARSDLIGRLQAYAEHHHVGICAALESFAHAYGARTIAVPEAQREILGAQLSAATLRRWCSALKNQGLAALAGDYGNRAGTGSIESNDALRDLVVGLLAAQPHISAKQVHRALDARLDRGAKVPALRTVQRFLDRWKTRNAQTFTALRNPDQWKNRYMPAFGNASEGITRLNQRWEFDSTPGDLQLVDGRHVLVGVIDIWSRRAMLVVSKTSSGEAICQILRRSILAWGVPELAKIDNGQDYVGTRVQGVLRGLGVDVSVSAPFSPWEKPHIERFFRSFSHDLLEILPSYSGHNVAEAQELRARQSFAERLFKKNATTEIKLTAEQLQVFCDRWCAEIYEHQAHDGLQGASVFERIAAWTQPVRRIQDERALDLLLADMPTGAGGRTVSKKGLRIDGMSYIAPELAALVGERVAVKYDPSDVGRVIVYHDDRFACIAECPEVLGVSRREIAIESKVRHSAEVTEKKRALRALGRKANARDLAFEILDAKARQNATLAALPAPNVIHITPAIEAARDAAAALDGLPIERPSTIADVDRDTFALHTEHTAFDQANAIFAWALGVLMKPADERNDIERQRLKGVIDSNDFTARWTVFEYFGPEQQGLPSEYAALLPSGTARDRLTQAHQGD